jgi:hypothetical protein
MKRMLLAAIAPSLLLCCSKQIDETARTPAYKKFVFGQASPILCTSTGSLPLSNQHCYDFFLIKDNQLFVDTLMNTNPFGSIVNAIYNNLLTALNAMNFQTHPMPAAQYQLAQALVDSFPPYLLSHPDTVMGIPGSHDQPLVYLAITFPNDTVQQWALDTDTAALPPPIRRYVKKVFSTSSSL